MTRDQTEAALPDSDSAQILGGAVKRPSDAAERLAEVRARWQGDVDIHPGD